MSVRSNDKLIHQFEIEIASADTADFWVFLDISAFQGETLHLILEANEAESLPVLYVEQSDEIRDASTLYKEERRPQFHFSSRRGWLNDPNGLVYYDGTYHLFYQHNPYGTQWGNMHWGHAVSRDLVHWTEVDIALYPDDMGTMFSGSGIVDAENTSGLRTGADAPLVLLYTAAGGTSARSKGQRFTQCLAYSNDGGKTWSKYDGNPVFDHIVGENRDPKIVWHEPTRQWIMALYLEDQQFTLLGSPDLKQWTRLSDVSIPRV